MKKLVTLVLVLAMVCSITAAFADPIKIDGTAKRNITVEKAGLNPSADEMIAQGISPTTGRNLDEIVLPDNFYGVVASGIYQPAMVQISHNGGAVGINAKGQPTLAPINGSYADVIYEAYQGGDTRMSMIYSDLIPDYVGFVRSTRLTHCRIRQEWECIFVTSGYSDADVPGEWERLGVKRPDSGNRTEEDPGYIYVGAFSNKIYSEGIRDKKENGVVVKQGTGRLYLQIAGMKDSGANSKVYRLAAAMQFVAPADHVPANHTWLFSEDLPAGGDSGEIVYVDFGYEKSYSRLEYDEEINAYYRYEKNTETHEDVLYKEQKLISPEIKRIDGEDKLSVADRVFGDPITFSNVIVQGIVMNWRGEERPDPILTGSGNADYFMGGKHYAGVWQRDDDNSRTVYYGEDGKEITLQPGKTLIVLMDYHSSSRSVSYE